MHTNSTLDTQLYPGKAGLPVTITGLYLRQMLSHAVSMHTFLMEAALLYRMNGPDPGFGLAEYHYNTINTIRNVNNALNNPEERYSDLTIRAISALAVSEVS
jgi:hypothetical protein